ncbi:MAG TPA: hypothetical protein VKY82_02110 [Flavobacterium sp.]|nr:hypothetical protein [Flavobacterium sp.]
MKKVYFAGLIFMPLIFMSFFNLKKESKEELFWKSFVKNEKLIYENVDDDTNVRKKIFDDISQYFKQIDENLAFEFSPIHENGIREFSISAEGIKESFPVVEKLISKSPKLKNWKFNAFRQRVPGDSIALNFGDYEIGYDDIYFRYSTADNQLGVELNVRNFDESGTMQNAIYVLLDGLLGEYDVTINIDWIEWVKLDENNIDNLLPLIELRDIVDNRK